MKISNDKENKLQKGQHIKNKDLKQKIQNQK